MAYNSQSIANKILQLKGDWKTANDAGNTEKANQAARNAQSYYNQLRTNGDDRMAYNLENKNYDQSKDYVSSYYAKQGKTAIRPYFYNLGAKYGLGQADIDKQLSFDDTTGEVTFGGKNMGRPDAISDGVSYWNPEVLDTSFNDYITRTGTSRTTGELVKQGNDNLLNKYSDFYDTSMQDYKDLKETDPFSTSEAKAILGKYDLSAMQGRDNALASGTASNGGNVDSYSAANAMRQQASLYSVGQQAVLDAYDRKVNNANTKLSNARQILSDMGVNIERMFNQDETARNNQVSRDVATAEVTGKVPSSMSYSNNPYFNTNGTLKNEGIDYQAIINNAKAQMEQTDNAAEKSNLEATIKYATQARAYKIMNNPAYAKYADGIVTPQSEQTEQGRQFDKQIQSAENLAAAGYQADLDKLGLQHKNDMEMAGVQTDSQLKLNNNQADNTIRVNNNQADNTVKINGANTDNTIKVNNNQADNDIRINGSQADNTIKVNSAKTDDEIRAAQQVNNLGGPLLSSGGSSTTLSDSDLNNWVKYFNEESQEKYGKDLLIQSGYKTYKVNPETGGSEYVAKKIAEDSNMTDTQKRYLLSKFNISLETLSDIANDKHYK